MQPIHFIYRMGRTFIRLQRAHTLNESPESIEHTSPGDFHRIGSFDLALSSSQNPCTSIDFPTQPIHWMRCKTLPRTPEFDFHPGVGTKVEARWSEQTKLPAS